MSNQWQFHTLVTKNDIEYRKRYSVYMKILENHFAMRIFFQEETVFENVLQFYWLVQSESQIISAVSLLLCFSLPVVIPRCFCIK